MPGSNPGLHKLVTAVGNTLYFQPTTESTDELWKSDGTASGTVMVKDIRSGGWTVIPSNSQSLATRSISQPPSEQRNRIVEERRNSQWHSDGQGHLRQLSLRCSLPPHSRWQHPLFRSRRRNQRKRIVEERWNSLRHGDGQRHQQRKLAGSTPVQSHSRWQHPLFRSQRRN